MAPTQVSSTIGLSWCPQLATTCPQPHGQALDLVQLSGRRQHHRPELKPHRPRQGVPEPHAQAPGRSSFGLGRVKRRGGKNAPLFGHSAPKGAPEMVRNVANFPGPCRTVKVPFS